jgi:hypothetical protein
MDARSADRGLSDSGVASVQFLLAAGLALILFLALANLVVVQYGRGAVRSALDQGARAGAISRDADVCESTASDVVAQLLGGRMSDHLVVSCAASGRLMVARGSAVFETWTPLSPDISVSLISEAILERGP